MRQRALWVAGAWLLCAVIVWLSLTPSPPKVDIEQGDKVAHFLAYGTLAFWFCTLYRTRGTRLAYVAGFIAMGAALEFLQGWTGIREFEIADMLANALGVLAGWGTAVIRPAAGA